VDTVRVKELVRQHWNRRAVDFDLEASHGLLTDAQARAWRRLIADIAGSVALDVLDIGCGTGFLSLLFAAEGHRTTGVDVAPTMLARAGEKAAAQGLAISFIEADVETLDLAAASYDLIVERHVIWTLPHPEIALGAWRRLLRPGGRLIMIEGHWGSTEIRDEYNQIYDCLPLFGGRPETEMAALVRARGFASVSVEPLMDPELWTKPPSHPRYLVTARA
jgi:ubiquinone/menaquinone biosynthesis C-methylase UbiE